MTSEQKKLANKHGTPAKFEKAVWKSYDNLEISYQEAIEGIEKYNKEWKLAGEKIYYEKN